MTKPKLRRIERLGFSSDPGAEKPTLSTCLDAVTQRCRLLGEGLMEAIERAALGAAGVAAGTSAAGSVGTHDPALKIALQTLWAQRDDFLGDLQTALAEGMRRGVVQEGSLSVGVSFDQLQWLDDTQLNESIELARAQEALDLAVKEVLPQVDALMSTLLGWVRVEATLNPLRPEVFVRALRHAVGTVVTDPDVRIHLVGWLAGALGAELKALYQELASWLRSQGIEAAGLEAPVAVKMNPDAVAKASAAARTALTLERLRRLLAGDLGTDALSADFLHTVPASVEAISDMQQVEGIVLRLMQKMRKKVEAGVPLGHGKSVSRREAGEQVGEEVIRLMLEDLTRDERLMPKVRDVIALLEPVLLQHAKEDVRIFSHKDHPVRLLLNRFTHRALGFKTESDPGYDRFLKVIQDAVRSILKRQGAPMGPVFELVIQKLDEVWAKEDEYLRQQREAAARALQHAEQRNLLAQKHRDEFEQRMAGKAVPLEVATLLAGPWAQAVAEAQLRSTDPTLADRYLALVDDLIWSVQPELAKHQRERLIQLIPGLLQTLREGLRGLGYNKARVAAVFDDLIVWHEAALEGGRVRRVSVAGTESEGDGDGFAASEFYVDTGDLWMGEQEAEQAALLNSAEAMPEADIAAMPSPIAAQELRVGTWAELQINGVWQRVQLTWASPHGRLFMFASATGLAHSMTLRTLQRLQASDLLRVVADMPLTDQALNAVAREALRNSVHAPPAEDGQP